MTGLHRDVHCVKDKHSIIGKMYDMELDDNIKYVRDVEHYVPQQPLVHEPRSDALLIHYSYTAQ